METIPLKIALSYVNNMRNVNLKFLISIKVYFNNNNKKSLEFSTAQ